MPISERSGHESVPDSPNSGDLLPKEVAHVFELEGTPKTPRCREPISRRSIHTKNQQKPYDPRPSSDKECLICGAEEKELTATLTVLGGQHKEELGSEKETIFERNENQLSSRTGVIAYDTEMDPCGTAIGVLGLWGTFFAWLEKIQIARDMKDDHKQLKLKLDVLRYRYEKCCESYIIFNKTFVGEHDGSLKQRVEKQIKDILLKAQERMRKFAVEPASKSQDDQKQHDQEADHQCKAKPRIRKVAIPFRKAVNRAKVRTIWAFGGRNRLDKLVHDLGELVGELLEITPQYSQHSASGPMEAARPRRREERRECTRSVIIESARSLDCQLEPDDAENTGRSNNCRHSFRYIQAGKNARQFLGDMVPAGITCQISAKGHAYSDISGGEGGPQLLGDFFLCFGRKKSNVQCKSHLLFRYPDADTVA